MPPPYDPETTAVLEAGRAALDDLVRDVADFPSPGVIFKDITILLADPIAFHAVVAALIAPFVGRVDKVAAIEARGFILGAPAALALGAGLIPLRKPGKLPWETYTESYQLEYGYDALEMHVDAILPGDRILLVDDVIATGGTARAAAALIATAGGTLVGLTSLLELTHLFGRNLLPGIELHVVADPYNTAFNPPFDK
jgi:adenine phosphoribosyltransferase